jgi:2-dehydro-3-deoxyglucarate aldolase/4-hydroxy-2-oxoheptanedioate aldolase
MVQIEHVEAVENIQDIVSVPGLASIVIGPNDLAGSMGRMGQPRHREVLGKIDTVIAQARRAGIPVGIGAGDDPEILADWIARGVQWLTMGGDCSLLLRAATEVAARVRAAIAPGRKTS